MAGGQFSLAKLFGITLRESADDGSDFTNPDADYRRVFLGEDGQLHAKDSSGTVTTLGGDVSAHTGDTTDAHDASAVSFDATGLDNTSATDVQTALEDFDAAITSSGGGIDGYGPTGRYHPDRPPTTGTASATDEFDDGAVHADWSWVSTAPSVYNETQYPGYFYAEIPTGTTNKLVRAYAPGAATAFAIAAKCAMSWRDGDSANMTWGIAVFDSSNNILWQIYAQNSGTSPRTNDRYRVFATAGSGGDVFLGVSGELYFCITRDAADAYVGYYSLDGKTWVRFGGSTVATAVAKVGFTIPTNSTGNTRFVTADFFRVFTSATTKIGK